MYMKTIAVGNNRHLIGSWGLVSNLDTPNFRSIHLGLGLWVRVGLVRVSLGLGPNLK